MTRCSYLDQNGKQCRGTATGLWSMHLDGEIYSSIHDPDAKDMYTDLATWVAVPLCKKHAEAFSHYIGRVVRGKVTDDKS